MNVRKITAIILSIILIILLTGCGNDLVSTEVKEVNAFVTNVYSTRYGDGITVEYDGAKNSWDNEGLYNYYKNCLGGTIKCYMIVRTYESGKVTKKLVYNQELIKQNNS